MATLLRSRPAASGPKSARRPTDWPTDSLLDVTADVACLQILMVNAYFIADLTARPAPKWVLIDAGLPGSAGHIRRAAETRFGPGARPEAIILTHGHFDHVGALPRLADEWDVPIYAHRLEMPYLTGLSAYPPADPTVGGGLMARSAGLYPNHPYDFRPRMKVLPADGTVPHLPGWRWIHTPGHAPGHVSLFRDSDRTLVAGDAFTTQKQESLVGVMTRHLEMHGPPMYFTPDWVAAADSVRRLAALQPSVAGTGHGLPMGGDRLLIDLHTLAEHFEALAVPDQGRYVDRPAVMNERGVVSLPPPVADPLPKILAGLAVGAAALAILNGMTRRNGRR